MRGTQPASARDMRALVSLVLLTGCLGVGGSGGTSRPGVMPMLSELPSDPGKRDAVLDAAGSTAGPEQRKGMTIKERKAETAAATAAAIIGGMFSSTQSVTLGSASTFDENQVLVPIAPLPAPAAQPDEPSVKPDAPPAVEADRPAGVPWIKLK